MDFLSLHESAPAPGPRLTRTEAIVASISVHLLLLLLVLFVPDRLPESVLRFLGAQRERLPAPASRVADGRIEPLLQPPRAKAPRIPLQFNYVRVPDDVATAKNPDAALLSDKDRHARQEVPTPPNVTTFTRDPHSEGKTHDRVRPDPARPEGPDTPEIAAVPHGVQGGTASTAVTDEKHDVAKPADKEALQPGAAAGSEVSGLRNDSQVHEGEGGAPGGIHSTGENRAGAPGDPSRSELDRKPGSESKFSFSNPGFMRGGAYGTLSFDTQGFPWGDYARKIYVIIRNNWFARIPLAAREGISGYSCQHFIIERDGTIGTIDLVRPSTVPPFNRAASDSLRASSALPPLPEAFPDPAEGVTFCFFYNMYPGEAESE